MAAAVALALGQVVHACAMRVPKRRFLFALIVSAVLPGLGILAANAPQTLAASQANASSLGPNTWLSIGGDPSARTDASAVWTGSEVLIWGGSNNAGTFFNDGARLNPATGKWTPISTVGAPSARANHTAVWTGTEMLVWGGCCGTGGTALGDGGRYNPATDTWSSLSGTGSPSGRFGHTAIWTGTEMIIRGGGNSLGNIFGDGARYNPASNTWTALPSSGAPPASTGSSAVWTGTEMLVWGGQISTLFTNTGARYNPATNTWAPLSNTNAPGPRAGAATVWSGSEMLIWGGTGQVGGPGGINVLGDGARYNPATDSWRAISSQGAPSARTTPGLWTGTEMLVWGGGTITTILGDGARYAPTTDSWTAVSSQGAPGARSRFASVWTGTDMVVWGGVVGTGASAVSAGFDYRPATNAWSALSHNPSQRSLHTAVWTGTQMLVWGGESAPFGYLGDGAAYTPATDTWVPLSDQGAPSARSSHTAVWTGTEMIVWGGNGPGGPVGVRNLADGARYNPTTGQWKPMSSLGAPSARAGHTAVWTGTEMIVWGGSADPGARYNPATDTWQPIAPSSISSGRSGHSAVWTGSEMIVWGGCQLSCFGDGASYDPDSNSWTPISSQGAPSARQGHTAVWTGAEMIAWGGGIGTGTGQVGDGARYDPLFDQWMPLSAVGAPSARSGHTAVWTGNQMLVWGGSSQGQPDGDGAAYHPALDGWKPLATGSAPAARTAHTAVWTGAEMIVWGGSNTGARFNDGGRFTPALAPPAFTSPRIAVFFVGETDSFTVSAGGQPTPTVQLTSGSLPSGLTWDASSGVLSGTPAAGTGGFHVLRFTASNGTAPDTVEDLVVAVAEAPAFTSPAGSTFTVGTAGTFAVTTRGFLPPTVSLSGALPKGVSFDSSTAVLSGTPAAGTSGIYPLTLTATNGFGPDATQNFMLTVDELPAFTSPAGTTFTVGTAGSFQVTAGGFPSPAISLSGTLPSGLAFDPSTGVLRGTPATGTAGVYVLTLTAANGTATAATQPFTLTVHEAPTTGAGGGGGGGGGGSHGGAGHTPSTGAPPASAGGASSAPSTPVGSAPAAAASTPGTDTNAPGPPGGPTPEVAAVPVSPPGPADEPAPSAPAFAVLSIGLVAADTLVPGQSAGLTLLLVNPGSIDASPTLTVQDMLPAGLSFADVATDGWTCASDDGYLVSCSSADMLAGGSQTQVQLIVTVADDAAGVVTNSASVNSPSLDPAAVLPTTVDALAVSAGDTGTPVGTDSPDEFVTEVVD